MLAARLLAELERPAEAGPALQVGMPEVILAEEGHLTGGGGQDADRAAHHGGGGGANPTAGAALVIAGRAEGLLQVVVGPWHAVDVVAMEQAGASSWR